MAEEIKRTSATKLPGLRVVGGEVVLDLIELIEEEPLQIRINGEPVAVLMRTPGCEIELAAGFCCTEGFAATSSEIASIGFCPDAPEPARNVVNVVTASKNGGSPRPRGHMQSRTSCGICGITMLEDVSREIEPVSAKLRIGVEKIVNLQYLMSDMQKLSRRTRSSHAAALMDFEGNLLAVREDVGRHNALDKCIGFALLRKIDLSSCTVLLSGRASFEMVQKAAAAGIPVVAAISGPTNLSVELAHKLGCTLVTMLRDRDFIIHTHPERLETNSGAPEALSFGAY